MCFWKEASSGLVASAVPPSSSARIKRFDMYGRDSMRV